MNNPNEVQVVCVVEFSFLYTTFLPYEKEGREGSVNSIHVMKVCQGQKMSSARNIYINIDNFQDRSLIPLAFF